MENERQIRQQIIAGQLSLGIEFGSTTVKAVLTTADFNVVATGDYKWENSFVDGLWTYSEVAIIEGLQTSYAKLKTAVETQYGVELKRIKALGISAMMHGYMPFDTKGHLLVPFRTWRNATTGQAASELTKLFTFNIPQRWSIAHLYQAILNNETHVNDISYLTTLAGYVHWRLSDEKILGIGDAAGVFPIDSENKTYNQKMLKQFDDVIKDKKLSWKIADLLPDIKVAGEVGGILTKSGALLLDPSGTLQVGAIMAPPEGDAGTGMVATNSVAKNTGNVSVGTSVFAMVVLDHQLEHVYTNIDMVTTPTGEAVAMVHANNSSSDINAWVELFADFAKQAGLTISTAQLYKTLFESALQADADTGGLLSYGYYSGENITGIPEGRPLLVRKPDSKLNVANLMRAHLFTAFGALKIGMRILEDEKVLTKNMIAQGGLFKTPIVAQKLLAAALNVPVTIMKTAGEGGPWGMAVLGWFSASASKASLGEYLQNVFANEKQETLLPEAELVASFEDFMQRYVNGLDIEVAAIKALPMK